ncbi:Complement component 1 Q subcomponent-binding protein, mitochondrial [Galemys pyrenaicus]|uniref:Complement component 1 Q subcomponent-binding protein, mitochondrial n=1 Tax=Galemys pyrenaicus TaxID=202257 RepID=A0A8J6DJG3_GALPY|nr:Complement component 1 Q subcomponent-binding protein, mitochondrial [Galemys pyrenaicus]
MMKLRKFSKSFPKMSGSWELEVNGLEAELSLEKRSLSASMIASHQTFDGEEEPSQGEKVEEQEPNFTSMSKFMVATKAFVLG